MENKFNLTDSQIETILNEHLDENSWLFQLGQGASDSLIGRDNDFSFPFYNKGKELWEKFKPLLKDILCDKEKKKIRDTIDEGVLGNVRELIVFVFCTLTGTHSIPVGIAIPLVAIVVKYNLQNFCNN